MNRLQRPATYNGLNNFVMPRDKNRAAVTDINMNFIFNAIEAKQRLLSQPETNAQIIQAKQDQRMREEEYIKSQKAYSISKLEGLRNHLNTIDARKFEELINDKFYDPVVMQEVMNITNSIFYPDPKGSVHYNNMVREWIEKLKQIGEKSAEGYAMSASLYNDSNKVFANDIFVVKAPQDPNRDNILHELFIGMQLNEFRKYTPFFAYTYGGFKCTAPVIASDKEVVSWCLKSDVSVNFVLYENIKNAIPFFDYARSRVPFEQILSKYLQALYASYTVNRKKKYTHYDLHPGNILIQDLEDRDMTTIPIKDENDTIIYLKTDKLARGIDPGFSYMEVDGKSYGFFDAIPYGVQYDKAFPIYDAYKLMMWLAYAMKAAGNIDYLQFEKIFRFFNKTDDFNRAIIEMAKTSYPFPYTEETSKLKLGDLLRYIRVELKDYTDKIILRERPNDISILGCDGTDICYTNSQDIVHTLMLDAPLQVQSVVQFYDLGSRLENENRGYDVLDILNKFDFNRAITEIYNKIESYALRADNKRKSARIVDITGLRARALLLNKFVQEEHENSIINILSIWDDYNEILFMIKAVKYLYRWYNGLESANASLDQFTITYVHPILESFKSFKVEMDKQIEYLRQLYASNETLISNALRNDNPVVNWYFLSFPAYYDIIHLK